MTIEETDCRKLLKTQEVAALVQKSASWLERSRWAGAGGPPYRKIGRSVRYHLEDVLQWLEAQPKISNNLQGVEDEI